MRCEIGKETRSAELAITNLVSNKHELNNYVIKFHQIPKVSIFSSRTVGAMPRVRIIS